LSQLPSQPDGGVSIRGSGSWAGACIDADVLKRHFDIDSKSDVNYPNVAGRVETPASLKELSPRGATEKRLGSSGARRSRRGSLSAKAEIIRDQLSVGN
jgi:hypothetical protein